MLLFLKNNIFFKLILPRTSLFTPKFLEVTKTEIGRDFFSAISVFSRNKSVPAAALTGTAVVGNETIAFIESRIGWRQCALLDCFRQQIIYFISFYSSFSPFALPFFFYETSIRCSTGLRGKVCQPSGKNTGCTWPGTIHSGTIIGYIHGWQIARSSDCVLMKLHRAGRVRVSRWKMKNAMTRPGAKGSARPPSLPARYLKRDHLIDSSADR